MQIDGGAAVKPKAPVTPVLDIEALWAGYGTVPVLRDVSLDVRNGTITTLIGANGAGKSTLIKTICGLIKPMRGIVRLFGENVTGSPPDVMVRAGIGLVPERRRLFSEMTLRENLELGAYARKDKAGIARDFERVLNLFPEIKDRLAMPAGIFSGGQQQMIAVARALMSGPKILLLDEPTVGLAPVVVQRIAALLSEISSFGVDILVIEQNAEMALSVADYGYVLENGQIVESATSAALLASPDVQRAYLGI